MPQGPPYNISTVSWDRTRVCGSGQLGGHGAGTGHCGTCGPAGQQCSRGCDAALPGGHQGGLRQVLQCESAFGASSVPDRSPGHDCPRSTRIHCQYLQHGGLRNFSQPDHLQLHEERNDHADQNNGRGAGASQDTRELCASYCGADRYGQESHVRSRVPPKADGASSTEEVCRGGGRGQHHPLPAQRAQRLYYRLGNPGGLRLPGFLGRPRLRATKTISPNTRQRLTCPATAPPTRARAFHPLPVSRPDSPSFPA